MVADSQPGHIDQIKQTNAGAVYRLIDQLGPVSRIDLSRFAQLAPASITKIVREMLEAHLVQETEIQEPGSRGRPAVGLMVETEAWHYLSIRISRGELHLALRDLSSALVVEEQLELALQHVQPFATRLLDHVDQFFIRHQKKLERLTAIAVTMPGIIDTEHGPFDVESAMDFVRAGELRAPAQLVGGHHMHAARQPLHVTGGHVFTGRGIDHHVATL